MEITIKHFDGQYPSFNIMLHANAGAEPFLEIKGCRIVSGQKGDFISYPARKDEKTGKYWNHVYGGEKFNAAVLAKAKQAAPQRSMQEPPRRPPPPKTSGSGFDDMDSDVPF
jgi:DNA-binding cell septation regulator SpoVG